MCGIAGAFAFGPDAAPIDRAVVARLNDLQAKRGPDGRGFWSSIDQRLVLGHRRLAIIDTGASGAQPMRDASGRWVITFNGEIYNYQALRSELERLGCVFRTNSDTEVLINVVAQWGEGGLLKLRGMYAFALWDSLQQELWLVRDPHGIKPLYVAESHGTIWFASQARALAKCAPVDTRRDAAALTGFYLWGHVPEPFCWWAGIRMLPPGHVQRVRGGQGPGLAKPYCRIEDAYTAGPAEPLRPGELRELMLDSVRHHLVADVPVGIFLSAGIDSNVIAALAGELGTDLRTVTLAFDEYAGTADDEAPLAEAAAAILGSEHTTVRIGRGEFEEMVDDFLDSMDQPSIDGLNTYLISRAAAMQGLKVALSGLGGDELFGGYPSFRQIPKLIKWGRRLFFSKALDGLIHAAFRALPLFGAPPKVAGLPSHCDDTASAYVLRRGLYLEDELERLLDPSWIEEGLEKLETKRRLTDTVERIGTRGASVYVQVAALESCWYMRNQLLRDTDWSSMAHSLEVRVPYVDLRVLERIGPAITSDRPPGKQDLAACAERLPSLMLERPKTGFTTPVRHWISDREGNSERGLRGWAVRVGDEFDAALDPERRPAMPQPSRRRDGNIRALPRPEAPSRSPRSGRETILIFRIGSIGDTVIALPCFHRIASSFPHARRIVLTNTPVSVKAAPLETVLGDSGLIDGVICFSPATRRLRELLELRRRIRATNARTMIYLSPRGWFGTARDVCFFRLCGIRRVIGAPFGRDLRQIRIDRPTGATEREAERLARCLAPLGHIEVSDPALWDLRLLPDEMHAADGFLEPLRGARFIAVNAGGKVPCNDWGDAHWRELLRQLGCDYADFALVLFGSQDEFERSSRIAADWPGSILNLCGRLTPRESAAALRRAVLFVGHDSGPMHLAAAVGTPCVAMFGDFNPPRKWHPFGAEHRLIHDMRGVSSIAPEQIHTAIRSVIAARAGRAASCQPMAAE